MSNNKDSNEPKFNEAQAYEELRMIIAIAIETQDFASLEPNIAIWENKYPLADFVDSEIVRKIKTILNKDYLSRLVGDYLASQVLHEQQRQQEAYNKLKKIIDTAKKSKDYTTAKKEVTTWKAALYDNGLSIYGFNKIYTRQILKMLLLPTQELSKQKEASEALKRLVDESKEMVSDDLSHEISSWQNKYSLETFPDDLKHELNSITADVFKTITTKRNEEIALKEVEAYVSSDKMVSPADEIPVLLSKYDFETFSDDVKNKIDYLSTQAMSLTELSLEKAELVHEDSLLKYIPPTQQEAIYDLKNIFSKNSYDLENLFNWIYLNRKIDFVPSAKDEIKALFSMAGFPKPTNGVYGIPSLDKDIKDLNSKDIATAREQVVFNYLGILYTSDSTLSTIEKDNISNIRNKKEVLSASNQTIKPAIVLPVLDDEANVTVVNDINKEEEKELAHNEVEDNIPTQVQYEEPEEINILIEDILKDPLESIEISSPSNILSKGKESSTIEAPDSPEEIQEIKLEQNQDLKPYSKQEEFVQDQEINVELQTEKEIESKSNFKESITDFSSDLHEESKQNIEEDEPTTSMLSLQDQISLEHTNYIISNYYIQSVPIHRRKTKKTLAEEYNYFPEKNNGF